MSIHFVVYCETFDWWWNDSKFVPRVGEFIEYDQRYKVTEVTWKETDFVTIIVDRI